MKINTMKSRILGLSLVLLLAVGLTLAAAEPADKPTTPNVKVEFTDKGELSLTLDGQLISQPTKTLDPTVRFRDPAAKVPLWGADDKTWPVDKADLKPQNTSFDAANRQLTQTFTWGEVVRAYRAVPDGVDIEVTVRNKSPRTLCQFEQRLFTLKMPGNTGPAITTEALYFGQAVPAASGNTLSGPVALPLVGGRVTVMAVARTRGPSWPPRPRPSGNWLCAGRQTPGSNSGTARKWQKKDSPGMR